MTSLALDILHTVYAGPDAAKRIAHDAGASYRTAENWWMRRKAPRADVFLRIAQSNATMRAELMRRLGEHGYEDKASDSSGVGAQVGRSDAGSNGGSDRPTDAIGQEVSAAGGYA